MKTLKERIFELIDKCLREHKVCDVNVRLPYGVTPIRVSEVHYLGGNRLSLLFPNGELIVDPDIIVDVEDAKTKETKMLIEYDMRMKGVLDE